MNQPVKRKNIVPCNTSFLAEYVNKENHHLQRSGVVPIAGGALNYKCFQDRGIHQRPGQLISGRDVFNRQFLMVPTFWGPVIIWFPMMVRSSANAKKLNHFVSPKLVARLEEMSDRNPNAKAILEVFENRNADPEYVLNILLSQKFNQVSEQGVREDMEAGGELNKHGIVEFNEKKVPKTEPQQETPAEAPEVEVAVSENIEKVPG